MIRSREQLARLQDIVSTLDGPLLKSGNVNRRRHPRVTLRTQLGVTILSTAPMSLDVLTRNISASGIAFVSRRLFRREERLAVLLQIPNVPPRLILARVTFSRYIRGGWYETGAEFLECVSDARAADHAMPRIPNRWMFTAHTIR